MVLWEMAVGCGPGMPGPYRAAMGKRDVSAGQRAAYMRPLQMAGEFSATIVGGGVLDAPRREQDFPLWMNRRRGMAVSHERRQFAAKRKNILPGDCR